jgi:hypothetical protein
MECSPADIDDPGSSHEAVNVPVVVVGVRGTTPHPKMSLLLSWNSM